MHICDNQQAIIGSGNGLSPVRAEPFDKGSHFVQASKWHVVSGCKHHGIHHGDGTISAERTNHLWCNAWVHLGHWWRLLTDHGLLPARLGTSTDRHQCPWSTGRWTYMVGAWCWHNIDTIFAFLAPVPLSIFRSNAKFDENSERSSFEYTWPTTTIFCTRHDSDTVVTCAKYRCDRPRRFYTRVFWIFIEFRIRSKYA